MTQLPPTYPSPMSSMQEAPGATAGLVLGIISIVFNAPILGFVLAFIGYQKSSAAKQLCMANPGLYNNAGVAQAGYVVSIVGMVLGGLSSICVCAYLGTVLVVLVGGAAGAAGSHP